MVGDADHRRGRRLLLRLKIILGLLTMKTRSEILALRAKHFAAELEAVTNQNTAIASANVQAAEKADASGLQRPAKTPFVLPLLGSGEYAGTAGDLLATVWELSDQVTALAAQVKTLSTPAAAIPPVSTTAN
jgi:hypothetical protein